MCYYTNVIHSLNERWGVEWSLTSSACRFRLALFQLRRLRRSLLAFISHANVGYGIVPIGFVIQWCVTDVQLHKRHPFISLIHSHNGQHRPSSFIAAVQSLERLCLFRYK